MLIARMLIRAVIRYMEPSAAFGAAAANSAVRSFFRTACLVLLLYISSPESATAKYVFRTFSVYFNDFNFFMSTSHVESTRFISVFLQIVGWIFFQTTHFRAFFAPFPKNFLLTRRAGSCILRYNSKLNRYDDREKVLPGRFRELPAAARQCEEDGRHWPSSISAETAGLGGNGFPHRYQRGGIRAAVPCRCRERAYVMPMRVVPRKFRLSSLLKWRGRRLFCCLSYFHIETRRKQA